MTGGEERLYPPPLGVRESVWKRKKMRELGTLVCGPMSGWRRRTGRKQADCAEPRFSQGFIAQIYRFVKINRKYQKKKEMGTRFVGRKSKTSETRSRCLRSGETHGAERRQFAWLGSRGSAGMTVRLELA